MSDIPDVLKKIVATKKEEVAHLYNQSGLKSVQQAAAAWTQPHFDFKAALAKPGLSVISEVKKASPSAGIIDPIFDYKAIAKAYEKGGADAISVLTDVQYFKGANQYLREIRNEVALPLLRKDFLIDPIQVYEAKAIGADAILLIAAILDLPQLRDLYQLGKELGLSILTEVHDEAELDMVLEADCDIIGINNRDLRYFTVDLNTTARLAAKIPAGKIIVGESGIKTAADAHTLQAAGSDAVLVGESLVRSGLENCGNEIHAYKNR